MTLDLTSELRELAAEFERIASLPAARVMAELGPLVDHRSEMGVLARVRRVRQAAAIRAVEQYRTQAAAAVAGGLSQQAVARMVKGERRGGALRNTSQRHP